jgi:hypothetical protein
MRFQFRFVGRPFDGRSVKGDSERPAASETLDEFEAGAFWAMTEQGKVGTAFKGLSEYGREMIALMAKKSALEATSTWS